VDYLTARVARIYTVYIPALLASLALDVAGSRWFDAYHLYSDPSAYHTISLFNPVTNQLDLQTFIGNLAMLQGIHVPILGSNGPLWSLAYEWWFYCLFLLVGVAALAPTTKRLIGCGASLGLLVWLLPVDLFLMGGLWMLGAVTYLLMLRQRRRLHPLIGGIVFAAAVIWSRLSHNSDNVDHPETLLMSFRRDLAVAAGYCLLLYSFTGVNVSVRIAGIHRRLADFSYSTYLVHFPMLVFITALLAQTWRIEFLLEPTVWSFGYLLVVTSTLCLYSYLFAYVTERHTNETREWIRSLLNARVSRRA
jgi:peptidoglycan/LPS O-acetylase OafA/YrhL